MAAEAVSISKSIATATASDVVHDTQVPSTVVHQVTNSTPKSTSQSTADVVDVESVHPAVPSKPISPNPGATNAAPGHRVVPSGDSSLFDVHTATSGYGGDTDFEISGVLDNELGINEKRGISYFSSPSGGEEGTTTKRKKLRLFLGASDLIEYNTDSGGGGGGGGGVLRSKYAYAVVYFREAHLVQRKHLSQESAVTEETKDSLSHSLSPTNRARSYSHSRTFMISMDNGLRGAMQGRTERARVCGREVEFARHFVLPYAAVRTPVVHVDVYGAEARDGQKVRLIGSTSCKLETLYARRGYHVSLNLSPPPPAPALDAEQSSGNNRRRRKKKPPASVGALRVAVEDVSGGAPTYYLDVQCACIRRARPWGAARVRRAFYTLHAVVTSDTRCDNWVLLYRSPPVESVRRKRDGGSMEYNYFSSRPLIAAPGLVIPEKDDSARGGSGGLRAHLRRRDDSSFFSMPSGRFMTPTPTRRLKLTVWEATAAFSGPEVVAHTELSVETLRAMDLGGKLDMRVHASVVGHAALKFVEKSDLQTPGYFCLSVSLPDMLP